MPKKYPIYIDDMIEDAVSRLKNLQSNNTFNFAFMPDTHNCTKLTERLLYAIREIDKEVKISFNCLGGDYLCNNRDTTKAEALRQHAELKALLDEFGHCPPVMVALGNHDVNPFGPPENRLSPFEVYSAIMSHHSQMFVENPDDLEGMYGYYDDVEHKVRAIYINPMDAPAGYVPAPGESKECMAIGNRQLNWIAKTALKMPGSGWGVVVFAHFMTLPAPHHLDDVTFGGTALWEILRAFKNGSSYRGAERRGLLEYDVECDYTGQGTSDVFGYFCGHYHNDWCWKVFGIPVVSCLCVASDNFGIEESSDGTKHFKTRGSGEESAASIFTVNRRERRIYCVRCGAGPDFSLPY